MALGAAVHGEWCGARTYPTRCRHCGVKVYYFECRCGCKVFFSELGGDWPEHKCLALLRATYGDEFVKTGMAQQMMKSPGSRLRTPIEKGYEAAIKGQLSKHSESPNRWTRRVDAKIGNVVKDTAVVREVIRDVNMFKKYDLSPESSMAMAFLGVLGTSKFGQVTFHFGHLSRGDMQSYTAFVSNDLLEDLNLQNGDLVEMELEGIKVGPRSAWLCFAVDYLRFSPD